ncbi:Ldh family oxidoreductase [Rubrobacter calidifluminis]|uniref:Ldh family oxidoreductase n=1 Tax=Rubrobacter calidifluminis TaxID=1392640 RepID=UPI0023600BAD|nr:Ldh family oxidoreductase [Rubrobacter calidifluminis]
MPGNLKDRRGAGRHPAEALTCFCRDVLTSLGVPDEDAAVVADSLVRANLEGKDSHGISRLPIYAKRIRECRISARPDICIDRDGAVLKVDGGNGLGQVVSYKALQAAFPVARETGIAAVAVRNSNHFGAASYYCQMACREGMALIATTNSPPGIAPWGGKRAYLGTNPVAFGFPTRREPPVIVDMSSSIVARGKIILAAAEGREIPQDWAIDEEGLPTTDAEAALRGAVLPLGGPKGYALAVAVEMLSGVLSGAAFGPHVNNLYKDGDPPANVGHSFILIDVEHLMPLEEYYARLERFIREMKSHPKARGTEEILYPGERSYRTYMNRLREGVTLNPSLKSMLNDIGRACGVNL